MQKIEVSKLTYNDLSLWSQQPFRQTIVKCKKLEKIAVSPQIQHVNDNPHMKDTPELSLQSFYLFQQMKISTQLQWQAL